MHARHKFPFSLPAVALLASSICASIAQAESERRDLSGFTAVDVGGGVDVDIRIGPEFLVEVDSGDEALDDIETRVRNGTLHISIDRDDWNWGDWHNGYVVSIVMPALEELDVGGGADVRVIGTITG
ncbi:MAG: DUF2807 domain-containing protein, partial [Pseudomonadota bacterium]|nr:DUF2807 domain-containing protein [Pseudomonadota bacterium]